MANKEILKIAVAETSIIIRSGLMVTLKRISGWKIQPFEIVSPETLQDCLRLHKPDILLINPTFGGYFDVARFKEESGYPKMKYIALNASVMDSTLLKNYDESVSLYDDTDKIREKLSKLEDAPADVQPYDTGSLSTREREIVVCVVKGMTNKEIADSLFLSAHTVITHRRNIAKKLQIHSSAGLTIYAIINKLVELQEIKDSMS